MSEYDKVRDYWDERASAAGGGRTATTNDIWLRELEIATISATIGEVARGARSLLDAGCGDGHATLALAEALPHASVDGVDYSTAMIQTARQKLTTRPALAPRIRFLNGDVTDLASACNARTYDVILTDRCLINLPNFERQRQALAEIAAHLSPAGHYLCIENFVEGQDNMNDARRRVGLAAIPIRWHNVFFREREFREAVEPHFTLIGFREFSSSYYLATRVIYSKLCQMRGEQPDYGHEIHRLAVDLPWSGQFSPVRLAVLRSKRDG